jgi:hypothetical protein
MNDATLAELVQDYLENQEYGPSLDAYLKFFSKRPLAEAIERSGYRIDGKVHDHQRLVGIEKLEQASQSLLQNIDEISR